MANNRVYKNAFSEELTNDCTVINLRREYPGYTGQEKYMLLTDLSEKELMDKHGEALKAFRPYIICGRELLSIINAYSNNEQKHWKRSLNNEGGAND